MKFKIALLFFCIIYFQNNFAQCFEIESVLVNSCDNGLQAPNNDEGFNEMVRFKVGNTPLNASNLTVSWSTSNLWLGLIQNSVTAAKVAQLNADIYAAGGCANALKEPVGTILPANSKVLLITSYNMSTTNNSFGSLTETTYIIFQNNPSQSAGHFSNNGAGTQYFSLSFSGACPGTITRSYATSSLVGSAGATVNYSPSGTQTYVNNGCMAPVIPFSVEAGTPIVACPGATISLVGTAQGQQSVSWSAPSGSFSSPNSLTTNYTISGTASGTITLTLTANNSCALPKTDTIIITISSSATPNFPTTTSFCIGGTAPTLSLTSPNGISGTWLPPTVNTSTSANYVFTPNTGQCASNVTLAVTVNPLVTPNFPTASSLCIGGTAPTLSLTSPNGISGTWLPPTVNTSTSANYVFTPNTGQCASNVTLAVTVNPLVTPNFPTASSLCIGGTAPTLSLTSPNGISGTWLPPAVNGSASGNYVFTPTAGQCASNVTYNITISNEITFDISGSCLGGNFVLETLPTVNSFDPSVVNYVWKNSNNDSIGTNNSSFNVTSYMNASSVVETLPATFSVIITNSEGCFRQKSFIVTSLYCDIQKGISPNGDNSNDFFDLSLLDVKQLSVFNRYGMKVYSKENYSNQWYGDSNGGTQLPDGTYYYVIEFNNQPSNKTGWVYINK